LAEKAIVMAKKNLTKPLPTLNEYKTFVKEKCKPRLIKDPEYYLKKFSSFRDLSNAMPCAVYLLDYTTQEYFFVSESCKSITGYEAKDFMKMGQSGFVKLCMYQEDAKLFTDKVFLKFVESAKEISGNELKNCRFSLNYRFVRKDGEVIKILQQSVVIETNDDGYPLISLGIITDMTAHKKDNKMVLSISHFNDKTGFQTISSDSYSAEVDILSIREKEIIKHIVFGNNTTKIADILFISPFTVKAHRRNILEKTKCKNIAELINYAINNGIA
jgi:DNA-binding CsgD family transcriptional regulator